jgi:oligopeptide/dipeptide ABC transporter ATP-binding protein
MSDYLEVKNLKKHFSLGGHQIFFRSREMIKAVDGVSFSIPRGSTFGLVGESGCGKSTVGKLIIRLLEPNSGTVLVEGANILNLNPYEFKKIRRNLQIIFQDPFGSLNPNLKIRDIMAEPFLVHGKMNRLERIEKIRELLELTGLDGNDTMERYPHEFSGGQRQRICIARALALHPGCIICDEVVSALDVSIQAQILNLLISLQKQMNITYLFISHNLGVVQHISDYVGVMYLGKMVETAKAENIFTSCGHPYTEALINAIPQINGTKRKMKALLSDEVSDVVHLSRGCRFYPRCRYKTERCLEEDPELKEREPGQRIACHNPLL